MTARSTFHEGTGYGGGSKGAKTPGEALELAIKEAETDAFKRALRRFGEALGNCLYDKDYLAWIEKVRGREGKRDPEKLFNVETLLRKPLSASPASQPSLSSGPQPSSRGGVDHGGRPVSKDEFDDDEFFEDPGLDM
ncbi:rad52/22 family double-strand break repair protein [Hirsutella rhossiliensis]|uniref:Rad52/22 family double-strand break repair protein n=1 Tax=Hirsutella rhossiliensis TaxID=111463 RepID=A0A9P8SI25_9HYPO|nr:rad52/22 family double-strand break repair protein [Hirsutella rhossiliensis]KAH0963753.1 rad52/22 family double-strand break repair protein [Hirsutella rhossiliensis]